MTASDAYKDLVRQVQAIADTVNGHQVLLGGAVLLSQYEWESITGAVEKMGVTVDSIQRTIDRESWVPIKVADNADRLNRLEGFMSKLIGASAIGGVLAGIVTAIGTALLLSYMGLPQA